MTKFDEPEGDAAGGRREEAESPAIYDPLFDSWDTGVQRRASPAFSDDPFAAAPAYPLDDEDAPWLRYQVAGDAYTGRYDAIHQERLTEWQRRLREGTITIPHPERRWTVTVRELAETLLLAVLIFLAVRASFQNFRVEGASMQPSLDNGEYLIVNKLSYAEVDTGFLDWLPFFDSGDNPVHHLWGEPERGDVIVFRAPTSPNRDFIKRIIGVPGDTVEIVPETGEVMVNGQLLEEPYIQGTTACGQECAVVIPAVNTQAAEDRCGSARCYFVMGDNRQNSSDSRQGWLVPEENIIGKALITYWHDGSPEIDIAPNHSVDTAGPAAAEE